MRYKVMIINKKFKKFQIISKTKIKLINFDLNIFNFHYIYLYYNKIFITTLKYLNNIKTII